MAKTEVQAQSVADRLRKFLKLEDRFNELDRTRRWSAKAMKRAALTHYPEDRLRQLRKEIEASPDPGTVPRLIQRIQRDILASPHYMNYVPPSKADHILTMCMRGNREAAEHDLNRFKTDIAEVYALAVLEATEDSQEADCFGPCDDPQRAAAEMDDLTAKLATLKESLRAQFTGEDVGYGDAVAVGGRRMSAAFYKITNGEVELGAGPDGLIPWARAHRAELGVS